jgi:predicted Zn finger-like uncharacterized protein
MAIIIECPSCAAKAQVGENAVGRSVRCPKCLNQFVVNGAPLNGGHIQTAPSPSVSAIPPSIDAPRPAKARSSPTLLAVGSLLLAGLAVVLAATALGITLFRPHPLGAGMSKYDFSTPKAALRSETEVRLKRDLRALLEMGELAEGPKLRERLDTLEVVKEAQWGNKTILFFSYKDDGEKKHHTEAFEKDAKSGVWMSRFVSQYDAKLQKENPQLAEQIRNWESKGELTPEQQVQPIPRGGPGVPKDGRIPKDDSGKMGKRG